jgi:hypothetical protein
MNEQHISVKGAGGQLSIANNALVKVVRQADTLTFEAANETREEEGVCKFETYHAGDRHLLEALIRAHGSVGGRGLAALRQDSLEARTHRSHSTSSRPKIAEHCALRLRG